MNLVLDTEFNGWRGELISMALVPEIGGAGYPEFYEEVQFWQDPLPWVAENVIPKLTKRKMSLENFQNALYRYLVSIAAISQPITIYADYPDDIAYFCRSMITGPGTRIGFDHLRFNMQCDVAYVSDIPHHALHDARALRDVLYKATPPNGFHREKI